MFDRDALTRRLSTVVGIPAVPYAEDGTIDRDLTVALTTRMGRSGVEALTANGNTGEFYALSPAERRSVLADVATAARESGAALVAGVGLDVATAVEEARLARAEGAAALMVHQPVGPYLSRAGWVAYNAAVAAAVPEVGVLPYLSSPAITGADLTELVERAPNVVGLKYSVPDPAVFATVRADAPADLLWICGLAETYAPAFWQGGARGFTSGLVNLAPEVPLRMLAALRAGDYDAAGAVWREIRPFEHLRGRDRSADNVAVVKEAMAQRGLCRRDVRPPSHVLSPAAAAEVTAAMAAWTAEAVAA